MAADIVYNLDPANVIAALRQMNAAQEAWEKGSTDANTKVSQAFERVGDLLLKVNDKQRKSLDQVIAGVEKYATSYGQPQWQRIIQQRDDLIKKFAAEEDAVKRLTAAYDPLIRKAREAAMERSGGGGAFRTGFLGAKDVFEGRNAYATVEFAKSVSEISGIVPILGVAVGSMAAFGAASFEAAKSLAEYGLQIRDAEIRTGLTSRQVGQFGFAMKAVGQDISLTERLMRGLTEALEGGSTKAQNALHRLGVEVRDVQGNLKPTAEILEDISAGLNRLPDTFERNRALMDIFKRVGIEAAPALLELNKNIERAKELGLGPSEQDVERWTRYKERLTEVSALWEKFTRQVKELMAPAAIAVLGAVTSEGPGARTFTPNNPGPRFSGGDGRRDLMTTLLGAVGEQGQNQAAAAGLRRYLGGGLLGAEQELNRLKQAYEEVRNRAAQTAQASSLLPSVAREQEQAVERARIAYERQHDTVKLLEAAEARRIANLERIPRALDEMAAKYRMTVPYILGGQLHFTSQFQEELGRTSEKMFGGAVTIANRNAISPADLLMFNQLTAAGPGLGMNVAQPNLFGGEDIRRLGGEQQRIDMEKFKTLQRAGQLDNALFGMQAGPGAAGQSAVIEHSYQTRITLAQQEYEINKRWMDDALATSKLIEQTEDARLEKEIQIAELQKRQHDEIARTSEGLYHTLFTNPSAFGGQLRTTVRNAALHPIEQGLGNLTANFLQPLIFGDRADPIKVSVDTHVRALQADTAAIYAHANAVVGGGGAGAGTAAIAASGGGGGLPASMPTGVGGGGGIAGAIGSIFGGGGTSIATPPFIGGGSTVAQGGRFGGFNLGSIFGGKGGIGGFFGQGPNAPVNAAGYSGLLASPAAALGGMALASQSLMGSWAGTGMGVLGGTAGGALVGFSYGGPLGAAIGAAAGFGIGLGEMLAGVEPQWKEAERLVRDIYHISINRATADQIVNLAKQSYGNRVSVAVRSPEVRQMLGLYAAGTGQFGSFPQSAMTPHGASLVESGGVLSQQSTYQYGNPLTYQSPYPTYGGGPTGSFPTPGGGPLMQFNIQGSSVQKFFDGSVFAPSDVAAKFSSAMDSSIGRQASAQTFADPGTIVS